jgi:hypothetical protein
VCSSKRGFSLGITLLIVALAMVAATIVGVSATFQLGVSAASLQSQTAVNLATSAVAQTLEHLLVDPAFGQAASSGQGIQLINSAGTAVVCFDYSDGELWDVPMSLNNLAGTGNAFGWMNQNVPGGACLIVAHGTCRGITRTVEEEVSMADWNYAIGCDGSFHSDGGLTVADIATRADASKNLPPGALLPGNLLSNSNKNQSVYLSKASYVAGNVQGAGGIRLDPNGGTTVAGSVLPYSSPVALPAITVHSFDSQLASYGVPNEQPSALSSPSLSGYNHCANGLVVSGDLTLNNAVVMVEGPLTISGGGVKGLGALLVDGAVTMNGGSNLTSPDLVALVASGSVSLNGNGQTQSSFKGLICCASDFQASNISLVGAYMATAGNGTTQLGNSSPGMNVTNVTALYNSYYTQVSFALPSAPPSGGGTSGGGGPPPSGSQTFSFDPWGSYNPPPANPLGDVGPWNFPGPNGSCHIKNPINLQLSVDGSGIFTVYDALTGTKVVASAPGPNAGAAAVKSLISQLSNSSTPTNDINYDRVFSPTNPYANAARPEGGAADPRLEFFHFDPASGDGGPYLLDALSAMSPTSPTPQPTPSSAGPAPSPSPGSGNNGGNHFTLELDKFLDPSSRTQVLLYRVF